MDINRAQATPEEIEKLEEMGFRQNVYTGDWVAPGSDKMPRLMVYPTAYERSPDVLWIASHPSAHQKFADPISAAVWLKLLG